MLRTAGALVAIFGTIFGGAYVLDRVAKYREKAIENQENDEVELDDFDPEDIEWHQIDLMEFMEKEQHCCKDCKCDTDGDRPCCGGCKDCKCENNEE
jgi:hypothetical protein